MSDIMPLEITLHLLPEQLERLQAEAERLHLPLPELVQVMITIKLDNMDEPDDEDTPDEQILADFRQAWQEAVTGQTRPVDELLAEIESEMGEDAA